MFRRKQQHPSDRRGALLVTLTVCELTAHAAGSGGLEGAPGPSSASQSLQERRPSEAADYPDPIAEGANAERMKRAAQEALLAIKTRYVLDASPAATMTVPADTIVPTTRRVPNATARGRTNYAVTPTGAATVSIPLWVPPGRAALQPELSLEYNSSYANGLLGMGWLLDGLPRIGDSSTATFSGTRLNNETYYDLRFRAPGDSTDYVALNWQQGRSATHNVATGMATGIWTVTGVRAHQDIDDHAADFVSVSVELLVTQ